MLNFSVQYKTPSANTLLNDDEKKKIASQIVLAAGVWSYEIIKESFNLSIPSKILNDDDGILFFK